MNKPFTTIAAIGFAIIALLHLWRLLAGTPINIGTVQFPVWASVIALLVTALLAWGLWKEKKR